MTPEQQRLDDEDVQLTNEIEDNVVHGPDCKIGGITDLQGFAYRVYLCRKAQISYFQLRNMKVLAYAKRLEKELDERLTEILSDVIELDSHLLDESDLPY